MDLTEWLEFFVGGLATQLSEVKERGAIAIRSDVIARQKGLNPRQTEVLNEALSRTTLTLGDLEQRFPHVNRRTLQRDLKILIQKGLLREVGVGATDPNRYYAAVTSYDREL